VNAVTPIPYRIDKDLYKKTISRYFPDIRTPLATRNSLENWPELLAGNRRVREFLFDHLRQRNNPVFDFVIPEKVEAYMVAASVGKQQQSLKVRAIGAAKDIVRSISPGLYRTITKQTAGKVKAAYVPTAHVLARVLVLKLWFDRR
jgi:hypothetical protein